jgi:hypothetical protein
LNGQWSSLARAEIFITVSATANGTTTLHLHITLGSQTIIWWGVEGCTEPTNPLNPQIQQHQKAGSSMNLVSRNVNSIL